jgi:hypothetical protein
MSKVTVLSVVLCLLVFQARAIWIACRWLGGVISLGDATARDSDGETQRRHDSAAV